MPASGAGGNRPELGSDSQDPLILDLVTLNPTSVRLRNAITLAAAYGGLPFDRVSGYLAAGRNAMRLLMLHVQNLGIRSANELEELIQTARPFISESPIISESPKTVSVQSATELRKAFSKLFDRVMTEEAMAPYDPPVRLVEALRSIGFAERPLEELLGRFSSVLPQLLRLPNMGRTSLKEGRRILGCIIADELRRRSFGPVQVAAAECQFARKSVPPFALNPSPLGAGVCSRPAA